MVGRISPEHSPATLNLIILRPFVPFIARYFSLYWRNKLVDWFPISALRDLRHIVHVMDEASNTIFSEKKAEMEKGTATIGTGTTKSGGNSGDHTKGKDMMTMLRASGCPST